MRAIKNITLGYLALCLGISVLSYNMHQNAGDHISFIDCFGSVLITVSLMIGAALTVFAPFTYPVLAVVFASIWFNNRENKTYQKPDNQGPTISHHYHVYTPPKHKHSFGKRGEPYGPRPGYRDITPRNRRITK